MQTLCVCLCVLLSLSDMLSILSVLYYDAKLLDIGRWCSRIALELKMQEKKMEIQAFQLFKNMQFIVSKFSFVFLDKLVS